MGCRLTCPSFCRIVQYNSHQDECCDHWKPPSEVKGYTMHQPDFSKDTSGNFKVSIETLKRQDMNSGIVV